MGLLVALSVGCGDEEDPGGNPPVWPDPDAGGSGGDGGAGGEAGQGGEAGTGNNGGQGGASGMGGEAGSGGSGGVCHQIDGEPNDTSATANQLDAITDCDNTGSSVMGTLDGDDEDWYTFEASDDFGCSVDPSVQRTSGDTLTLCVYFNCVNGGTTITCPSGAQDSTSDGHSGCCTTEASLEPEISCDSMDEGSQVWVHVSAPGNDQCLNYNFDYRY
jgi:hypothetical protein